MSETQTRNLGELFREALKNNPTPKQKREGYIRRTKNNKTGIDCVSIVKCPGCRQGFMYQFASSVTGERVIFKSVDILKLKDKAIKLGYKWSIFDETLARKTAKKANISYGELI